jgi:SPP1 family predicted phage head-tail adaptor
MSLKRKHKRIKFYRIETIKENGEPVVKRINFEPSPIKAYIRQLSADERINAKALQDDSSIEVTINKRKIEPDMYIDFGGQAYQIGPVDYYDFHSQEVKFRAKPVMPASFDTEETRNFNE